MAVLNFNATEQRQLEVINSSPSTNDRTTPVSVSVGRYKRNNSYVSEAVLGFNLASLVGATISSVTLQCYVQGFQSGGASGLTAPVQIFRQSTLNWSAGTNYGYYDFGGSAWTDLLGASASIGSGSVGQTISITSLALKQWVQDIANGTRANWGLIATADFQYYGTFLQLNQFKLIVDSTAGTTEINLNSTLGVGSSFASSYEIKKPMEANGSVGVGSSFESSTEIVKGGTLHNKALKMLLPFTEDSLGFMTMDLNVEGRALDGLFYDIQAFHPEIFPDSTLAFLEDWERVFGLDGNGKDLSTRRKLVLFEVQKTGGLDKSYFVRLGQSLGYNIDISSSFNSGTRAGIARAGDTLQAGSTEPFIWVVSVYGVASAPDLERLFRQITPVHTKPIFAYYTA
jgi:uncharacterized protein YmfQ (DUF2313 family)